jgi:hypothetical protein
MQRLGKADVRGGLLRDRAVGPGQRDRFAQRGRALLDVAQRHQRRPHGIERATAEPVVAERVADGERLAGGSDGLVVLPAQHQALGPLAEQHAALVRDLVRGQERQPVLDGDERVVAAAEMPLRMLQDVEQVGGLVRLGALVDEGQRGTGERLLASEVGVELVGLGGAGNDRHAIGAGERFGLGHAVEQLESPFVQRRGLAIGMHALGRRGGAHRGPQRGRLIAGGRVVVGDRGGQVDAEAVAVGARLERAGQAQVDRRALAGQQVVVDDLAQQRVAEAIAALGADDEDVVGDRLAQRLVQRRVLEPGRGGEQLVVELLADGDDAQDLLRRRREPLDADHQRIAQRRRQAAAAVEARGEQLLDE